MDEVISLVTEEKQNPEEHMGLVHMVVKRYLGRGIDQEDLIQIGCIGLVKACERFDAGKEVCFSTYAVPMIQGEIRRAFRDSGKIHMGRHLKELSMKVSRYAEAYEKEYGKEPTLQEIAKGIQAEEEEVIQCMAGNQVGSLDACLDMGDGQKQTVGDQICAMGETAEQWTDRVAIEQAMARLSEKERHVILLRFFQDKSQSETAREIKLSQAQISRIEKGALGNLRMLLE